MKLEQLPKPFFVLAPMDDVTDTVFRQIVAKCAVPDLFFTEFVNVDGLQSPGREKIMPKLWFDKTEHPIIAQIWGLKPENYYKTVKDLKQLGFVGVDINMGCPVKTVIKNGACAALINNRGLAGEIIDAVKKAAGNDFPVSVKTRVGFKEVDMSWLEFLLTKKLNMLSIHGRTVKQLSNAPADWELLGKASHMRDKISPETLIVGNGDVASLVQGVALAKKHNIDGVMIGRGIFHDPFVFAEKSPWADWTKEQKIELFIEHIKLYQQTYKNKERKFEALRKFCKVYINGFYGAPELRADFMQTKTPVEAIALLAQS